jgi:lysophospholipase L1-like esterase
MDDAIKTTIWDDGLHLTDKGYDMMGQLIAKRLAELLGESS